MKKTLVINAHPDFQNHEHKAIKMADYFIEQVKKQFPDEEINVINLSGEDIPIIDKSTYRMYRKGIDGTELTIEEQKMFDRSRSLLNQFKEHHRIVIASPLLNFNIVAKLKDYIDNIMVAREVFRYTPEGSVGLMTDDYQVLYMQSSGSIYTNDDRYTPLEFSNFYLKSLFENIMGFDKYYIARAQGTDLRDANQELILADALSQIDEIIPEFYK